VQLLSSHARAAGPASSLNEATSLCACDVVDTQGNVLGSLVDLMLDLDRGCIAYAVVATGGFMGIGERLFAIPWKALRFDGAQLQLQLQRRRPDFEDAPSFDRDHWPRTAAPSWHQRVHAYYRSRPYWE
jgi:sporulation protein YlmC with PRC-barrel domain